MRCAALAILLVPLAQEPVPESHEGHVHSDDFQAIVDHHSQHDLQSWLERHPWEIGTEIRAFVHRYQQSGASTGAAEQAQWIQRIAFLAEALADDALTPWLLAVLHWDAEQRARFETVRSALVDLAASVESGGAGSVLADLAGLRPPTAPEGAFLTLGPELLAVAHAAGKAGTLDEARAIAAEVAATAEATRDGIVAIEAWLLLAEDAGRESDLLSAAAHSAKAARVFESLGDREAGFAQWRRACEARELLRLREPLEERREGGPDPRRQAAFAAAKAGLHDEAWQCAEMVYQRALAEVAGDDQAPRELERARSELAEHRSKIPPHPQPNDGPQRNPSTRP